MELQQLDLQFGWELSIEQQLELQLELPTMGGLQVVNHGASTCLLSMDLQLVQHFGTVDGATYNSWTCSCWVGNYRRATV